ncbi:uncharacterized protein GGS22DRAFT_186563 [Annulohypoxylon maeteangense]|uniref:uncharacterized protein n=1 Tax=Annulohypoxylon maeteangense TaxID=1927788 RepID=UPI002008B8FB|nr:uncharacterized protein GGS22DRAFT_186563 [Annulohypoxylon maeteangense]KAI0886491.1 hypothetical protein GGS22DRAFT_186563 [Annulohypoxylon maeteangense]
MRSQTFWRLSLAVLGMACHGVAGLGYWIDEDSCNPDMRNAVASAVERGLKMARAGVTNANNADRNPAGPEQKLIDNLFGEDPPNAADDKKIKNIIRNMWGGRFSRITRSTRKPSLSQTLDIVIYCDERRLKVRKSNPLKSFDTDTNVVVDTGDCIGAVAYVTLRGATDLRYNQLQICPAFMNVVLNSPFRTGDQLPTTFWSKMVSNFVTFVAKIFYTPIDATQLAEKVLLHELTHTEIGGDTEDVGGFFKAYGWKNCRTLSRTRGDEGGDKNADTWALYGSVSLLIQEQEKTVDTDTGNIIAITSVTARAIQAVKSAAGRWMNFVA